MRRLTQGNPDDRGVATVFLIMAMTVMLVGAALAIDVGQHVVEKRSAQNSADATVLAVAADCVLLGAPIDDYTAYYKAEQTISDPFCDLVNKQTEITVTKEVDGLLLPQSAGEANEDATAEWGTLRTANAIPLVIADCEFDRVLFGDLDTPVDDIILYADTPPPGGCSSPAGGFGMLDTLRDNRCETTITAGENEDADTATGNPGNKLKSQLVPCLGPLPTEILVPMYDTSACELSNCKAKGNGSYLILGFARFRVTGYSFGGNSSSGTLGNDCPDQAPGLGQLNCIRGDFLRFLPTRGTLGPSEDFGVVKVSLSS